MLNNLTREDLLKGFDLYFESLKRFLYYKTGDIDLTEDLVQEVFIKVWEKRTEIKKDTMKSFLFKIGNNLVIDHFRHKKIVMNHHEASSVQNYVEYNSPQFIIEEKEFEKKLEAVLKAMPEGCREVFLMNRIDQLKYNEIAERLDLSVKAIEKRMSKAIGIVKEQLGVKI